MNKLNRNRFIENKLMTVTEGKKGGGHGEKK